MLKKMYQWNDEIGLIFSICDDFRTGYANIDAKFIDFGDLLFGTFEMSDDFQEYIAIFRQFSLVTNDSVLNVYTSNCYEITI